MKIRSAIVSAIVIFSGHVHAAEPAGEPKQGDEKIAAVAVDGIRNPELKPYRVMAAGLDAFDEYHRLAPAARLRFKLHKRGDPEARNWNWDTVTMRLAGNDSSLPVPIAADGSFVLPRNQQAWDDEADLILNQKQKLIGFAVDVRTPGVPANARRLGDLRLECQVIVAIGKKELNFAQRMALNTIMLGGDWCGKGFGKFGFGSPELLISASILHAGTRRAVPASGHQYTPPIPDKSLPDDALVELEYWSTATTERKLAFFAERPVILKSSVNKWGAGSVMRPSGKARYVTELALQPGNWDFHLDSKGAEVSLGGLPGGAPVVPGVEHAVHWNWKSLPLKIDEAGTYEFSLNVEDPDHPVINVKRTDA